jgi:hypothetical protein
MLRLYVARGRVFDAAWPYSGKEPVHTMPSHYDAFHDAECIEAQTLLALVRTTPIGAYLIM